MLEPPLEDPAIEFVDEELQELYSLSIAIPNMVREKAVVSTLETMEVFPGMNVEGPTVNMLVRINAMVQSLVQAYILEKGGDREENAETVVTLPNKIAQWSVTAAHRIGCYPTQTYETYILGNYRLVNPELGFKLENVEPLVNFSDSPGEAWFIKMHVVIEHLAAAALHHAYLLHHVLEDATELTLAMQEQLIVHFDGIAEGMKKVANFLLKMQLHLTGTEFFQKVRPFLKAWQGGVVYEGVEAYRNDVMFWRGASGAQSSILPTFDRALQIPVSQLETMQDMFRYMPPQHQRFLLVISSSQVNLLATIQASNNEHLFESYKQAVGSIVDFRSSHYGHLIVPFILDNLISEARDAMLSAISERLPTIYQNEEAREKLFQFGFELIKALFMLIKKAIVQHEQGQLLEADGNEALNNLLASLRENIPGIRQYDSAYTPVFSRELPEDFSSQLFEKQQQACSDLMDEYNLGLLLSASQIQIVMEEVYESYVATLHKSLGTGGSDFSYFLQRNIQHTRDMFKQRGQVDPSSAFGSCASFFSRLNCMRLSSSTEATIPVVRLTGT